MSARSRDLCQAAKSEHSAVLPVSKPQTNDRLFLAPNCPLISKWPYIMDTLVLIPYGTNRQLEVERMQLKPHLCR